MKDASESQAMVVDIGAYTTDYAVISWPRRIGSVGEARVQQHSERLGVKTLDEWVFGRLSEEAAGELAQASENEREHLKYRVYAGSDYVLMTEAGRQVPIGRSAGEKEHVREQLTRFTEAVSSKARDLICKWKSAPKRIFLTGGGIQIAVVRKGVKKALDQIAYAVPASGRELARGGSALGGCSVWFDCGDGLSGSREKLDTVRAIWEIGSPFSAVQLNSLRGRLQDLIT